MTFNINTFKSKGLQQGGARPALFEVEITPPTLPGITGVQEKISFLCRATSIPASTIGSVDVYHFGRPIKLAGDRTFADWQVNILNDEDFMIRDMLENWSNKINAHISNRMDAGYQSVAPQSANGRSYKAVGKVKQYGKAGPGDDSGIIRAYEFHGIFPVVVSEIDLGWDITDTVETFGCTFAYDYWIPIPKTKTGQKSGNPDDWGLLQPDNGQNINPNT